MNTVPLACVDPYASRNVVGGIGGGCWSGHMSGSGRVV